MAEDTVQEVFVQLWQKNRAVPLILKVMLQDCSIQQEIARTAPAKQGRLFVDKFNKLIKGFKYFVLMVCRFHILVNYAALLHRNMGQCY